MSPAGTRRVVVVATSNAGKQREIREILADLPLDFAGLGDFAPIEFPDEGDAYAPNAIAKAEAVARATGCAALADDSGLEVVGLDGGPGPLSARFGGEGLRDHERAALLLERLAGRPEADRAARFVCVAALAEPGRETRTATGVCAGAILTAPRGAGGFGYDPVFEVSPGVAMAELPAARKNLISHRARALAALREDLLALTTGAAR